MKWDPSPSHASCLSSVLTLQLKCWLWPKCNHLLLHPSLCLIPFLMFCQCWKPKKRTWVSMRLLSNPVYSWETYILFSSISEILIRIYILPASIFSYVNFHASYLDIRVSLLNANDLYLYFYYLPISFTIP